MPGAQNEAFSRVLIDKALEFSEWNPLDARVTEIRETEAAQAAGRQSLEALFQSMLHRASNGEL